MTTFKSGDLVVATCGFFFYPSTYFTFDNYLLLESGEVMIFIENTDKIYNLQRCKVITSNGAGYIYTQVLREA